MSKQSFEQNFTNPLLERLAESYRYRLESQLGQIIELRNIKDLTELVEQEYGIELTKEQEIEILRAGRETAAAMQQLFKDAYPDRFELIKNTAEELGISLKGKVYYVVKYFKGSVNRNTYNQSIDKIKDVMITKLLDMGIFGGKGRSKKEILMAEEFSQQLQKGHGPRGEAVSQVEIAAGLSNIPDKTLKNKFANFILNSGKLKPSRKNILAKLFADHFQRVTPEGKLTDSYVSIISFQSGELNQGLDAAEEQAIVKEFREFAKDFTKNAANYKGSSSLKDKVEKVVIDKASPKIKKSKNVKLKVTPKNKTKLTSKHNSKKSKKVGGPPGSYLQDSKRLRNPKTGRFISKKQAETPINIVNMLNAALPETVARNMIFPALRYRTGRFANSVRVIDAKRPPKGPLNIGYTYQKFPYQTFEPGYAQGTPERDPRTLIDKSIREIAASFIQERFDTRRI